MGPGGSRANGPDKKIVHGMRDAIMVPTAVDLPG
jgi:hypothetical protein